MGAIPRLADVHCSRIQFAPGDRVLVRVHHALSDTERKKLKHTVERWAGCSVEVLIIDTNKMEINIERTTT